jgi:hypothetical protein
VLGISPKTLPAACIAGLAILLCLLHLNLTPARDDHHDLGSRLLHINYIVKHRALPAPDACDQCSHPPLYVTLAAITSVTAKKLGLEPFGALNYLSFAFYMGFLLFSWRLITENISSRAGITIAAGIIFLWPLGYHLSRHINSDIPAMTAQLAVYYYSLRWLKHTQNKDLIWAMVWLMLGIYFKYSTLVSAAILAVIILYGCMRSKKGLRLLWDRQIITTMLVTGLLAAAPLAHNIYYHQFMLASPRTPDVFETMESAPIHLGNLPHHYLSFDWASYFTYPFYSHMSDFAGRQSVWNALLKTALFDEYQWRTPQIATVLSGLLLAMVIYTLLSLLFMPTKHRHALGFYTRIIAFNIVALLIYRYIAPLSCTQLYRYIYAITPLFAVLYARLIEHHWQQGQRAIAVEAAGAAVLFATLSVVFILLQHMNRLDIQ